jgi:hypothetical protein
VTVFIQIGNTDNKLTQQEWSHFILDTKLAMKRLAKEIHFMGFSEPDAPWQNACWCVVFHDDDFANAARSELQLIAVKYSQESIAWSPAPTTEFITGLPVTAVDKTMLMPVTT